MRIGSGVLVDVDASGVVQQISIAVGVAFIRCKK
jgi:hypothetical protein